MTTEELLIEMRSLVNEVKSELDSMRPKPKPDVYRELYQQLTDWMIDNKLTGDNVVWKKIIELEETYLK